MGKSISKVKHVREQLRTVERIEAMLADAGFSEQWIKLMVIAYRQKGGACELENRQRRDHADRLERLGNLLRSEEKTHQVLHSLLGTPQRHPASPRAKSRKAQRIRWATWSDSTACDAKESCESPHVEVRAHAEFLRRLRARLEQVQSERLESFLSDMPTKERELIEGKGHVLRLLHDWMGIPMRDIAVFIRVRVDAAQRLPINDGDLADAERAAREALRSFRREIGAPTKKHGV